MTGSSSTLVEALKAKGIYQLPQSSRPASLPKKQDHILEFIQAVLDGREAPHSISRIGRLFGRNSHYISYHYPQEAILVAAQYRAYRTEQARKRLEQIKVEVRTATFSLHTQGIFPSQKRVSSMLSHPYWMMMPETRATWHATRHELGLEP